MKNFNTYAQFVEIYRDKLSVMDELIKIKFLQLATDPDRKRIAYHICPDYERMSLNTLIVTKKLLERNCQADLDELYISQCIHYEGPIVFRPTTYQLLMMQETDLNISIEEYVQPFPTIIIELPEDYYKSRKTMLIQAGEASCDGSPMPDEHEPRIMAMNFNSECRAIISMLIFNSGLSIKTAINPKPNVTLEEALSRTGVKYNGTLEMSEDEDKISEDILRACMNYMLLVDEIGYKTIGPTNEKHYRKLQEYREKAQKRGDAEQVQRNVEKIRATPIYYSLLEQNVKLHKEVKSDSELPKDSGTGKRKMPPHRRRGHWRKQACGPRHSERKRIRIDPVFVHRDLFVGDMSKAQSVYK